MNCRKLRFLLAKLVLLIVFFICFATNATAMSRTISTDSATAWAIDVTGASPDAYVNIQAGGSDTMLFSVRTDSGGNGQLLINHACDYELIRAFLRRLNVNCFQQQPDKSFNHGNGDTFTPKAGANVNFTLRVDVAKNNYVFLTGVGAAAKTSPAIVWAVKVIGAPANTSLNARLGEVGDFQFRVKTDAKGEGELLVNSARDRSILDALSRKLSINTSSDRTSCLAVLGNPNYPIPSGVDEDFIVQINLASNTFSFYRGDFVGANAAKRIIPNLPPEAWMITVNGAEPDSYVNIKPGGLDNLVYHVITDHQGNGQLIMKNGCDRSVFDALSSKLCLFGPLDIQRGRQGHLIKHSNSGDTFLPGSGNCSNFTVRVDAANNNYNISKGYEPTVQNYRVTVIPAAQAVQTFIPQKSLDAATAWTITVNGALANSDLSVLPGEHTLIYGVKTDAKGNGKLLVNSVIDAGSINAISRHVYISYPTDARDRSLKHNSGDTFDASNSTGFSFILQVDAGNNNYNLLKGMQLNNTVVASATAASSASVAVEKPSVVIPAGGGTNSGKTAELTGDLFGAIVAGSSGDSVTYRSKMLLFKLSVATTLFGNSLTEVAKAWNMDADQIGAVDLAAKKAKDKPDDATAQQEYVEATKRLNDQVKERVEQAEKNNEKASEALKAAIRDAEIKKGLAWLINASAVPDAVVLVNDAYKIVNDPNASWLEKIFRGGQVLYTAYAIKKAIDEQSSLLTTYGDYMDKFSTLQDIPKPSDDEIKQVAQEMEKG